MLINKFILITYPGTETVKLRKNIFVWLHFLIFVYIFRWIQRILVINRIFIDSFYYYLYIQTILCTQRIVNTEK